MATGYDNDFVGSTEDYECPLCLHVTRDPTLTSCCGQHFCQTCINRMLTDQKPCPCCKETGFTVFLDKKQKRKVHELKVNCSMKARGCAWIGELGKLEAHLSAENGTCDYVNVICPKLCGDVMQKIHLPAHLLYLCPNRDHKCKHCGYEATFEAVKEHYKKCAKYPLPCPNKCGVGLLERQKLKAHIEECPLQEVECEYAQLGCKKKLQRKEIANHLECNLQNHLTLVTHQFLEAQRRIRSLEEKVSSVEVSSMLPPVELKVYTTHLDHGRVLTLFTHQNGYKLQVKLTGYQTMYNSSTGRNKHTFTVNITNVKCEHDDMLEWPTYRNVKITVFNQAENNNHYVQSEGLMLKRDGNNSKNIEIQIEDYKKTSFVISDTIQIRIDVTKLYNSWLKTIWTPFPRKGRPC